MPVAVGLGQCSNARYSHKYISRAVSYRGVPSLPCRKTSQCLVLNMLGDIKNPNVSPLDAAATGAGVVLLYYVYRYLTVEAARRKMIKQHGCKQPPAYPYSGPFGLRLAYYLFQRVKEGKLLETIQKRFQTYGNTMTLQILGEKC